MKTIFPLIATTALISFASCQKTVEPEIAGTAIEVTTDIDKQTKAWYTNDNFTAFKLTGYVVNNGNFDSTAKPLFSNVDVTKSDEAWEFADNKTYYWPSESGQSVWFYGLAYPNITTKAPDPLVKYFYVDAPIMSSAPSTDGYIYYFGIRELPLAENTPFDIIAVTKKNTTYSENAGCVDLTFKHILSQVRVGVKTSPALASMVTIKSVMLSDIIQTAFYYERVNGSSGWELISGEGCSGYYTNYLNIYTMLQNVAISDSYTYSDYELVIPQNLQSGTWQGRNNGTLSRYNYTPTLKINYTVGGQERTKEIALKDIPSLNEWKMGQKITYHLTINEDPITIGTVSVDDWTDNAGEDLEVKK